MQHSESSSDLDDVSNARGLFAVSSGSLLVLHDDGLLLLLADGLVEDHVLSHEQEHQPHSHVEHQHWKRAKQNQSTTKN